MRQDKIRVVLKPRHVYYTRRMMKAQTPRWRNYVTLRDWLGYPRWARWPAGASMSTWLVHGICHGVRGRGIDLEPPTEGKG